MVNLLLGVTFAEAAVFYLLAASIRRRSLNVLFRPAGRVRGVVGTDGIRGVVPMPRTTPWSIAVLGLVFLIASRVLGIERVEVYGKTRRADPGPPRQRAARIPRGQRDLLVAFLAAFLQSLARLSIRVGRRGTVRPVPGHDHGYQRGRHLDRARRSLAAVVRDVVHRPGGRNLPDAQRADRSTSLAEVRDRVRGHGSGLAGGLLRGQVPRGRRSNSAPGRGDRRFLVRESVGDAARSWPSVVYHRAWGDGPSVYDELAILTITVMMLITGLSWRVKSTTLIGGGVLFVYLVIMIGRLRLPPTGRRGRLPGHRRRIGLRVRDCVERVSRPAARLAGAYRPSRRHFPHLRLAVSQIDGE